MAHLKKKNHQNIFATPQFIKLINMNHNEYLSSCKSLCQKIGDEHS
jgi:hypothetical protein